jgi:hypothetical protein
MPNDLESAINALLAKQTRYNTLWQYYLGAQPVVYTNERLREIFRNVDASFTENWAALVVDAVQDRLKLKGVTVAGLDDAQEQVDALYSSCLAASKTSGGAGGSRRATNSVKGILEMKFSPEISMVSWPFCTVKP